MPIARRNADRNLVSRRGPHRPEERPRRQWARRGTRPRQPADQRYDNAYLFGAICPARGRRGARAALADTEAMQLHLDEISRHVAKGAHAVLIFDRAGWHTRRHTRFRRKTSPRSCCPRARPSSTQSRTSGSTCAPIGSPTGSSNLRRYHRRRLRGLAKTHAKPDVSHQSASRLGSRRSNMRADGITPFAAGWTCAGTARVDVLRTWRSASWDAFLGLVWAFEAAPKRPQWPRKQSIRNATQRATGYLIKSARCSRHLSTISIACSRAAGETRIKPV